MDISTVKGAPYVVTNTTGAEIEVQSAGGVTLCKVPATSQAAVYAVDEALVVPDGVVVTACRFNGAPVAGLGGGGASISVDQTYSSTSTNAQSGVAVARALDSLNCKAAGSYVKIGTEINGGNYYATCVGHKSTAADFGGTAVGYNTHAKAANSLAMGVGVTADKTNTAAIGLNAVNKDSGTLLLSTNYPTTSATYQTILYLVSAHTPLADTYENGEAFLGYVVRDTTGNIEACGTRKLSELLTNNTAFAPAAFGLDDEPTPGPFLPTGIMEPMEMEDLTESEQ